MSTLPVFNFGQFLTFFYVMMGPLRVVGVFAMMTRDMDEGARRRLAFRATIVSTIGLLVASYLGSSTLRSWRVSVGALALAAGITLFCVALGTVLELPQKWAQVAQAKDEQPSFNVRAGRLFSTIVTPYGIATVIVFLTLQPESTPEIIGAFMIIMALNLFIMLFARPIVRWGGAVLGLIGEVLSVLQVALSIEIINFGLLLLSARIR
jgi:multiple antibiotic resistance protein